MFLKRYKNREGSTRILGNFSLDEFKEILESLPDKNSEVYKRLDSVVSGWEEKARRFAT